MKKNKGFTLVELLVVVAIIAILAIAFMPNVFKKYSVAKEKDFLTKSIEIGKIAEEDSLENQLIGVTKTVYSSENNDLKSIPDDYEYYITLDESGKVKDMLINDKNYYLNYSSEISDMASFTIDNIVEYEESEYKKGVKDIVKKVISKNELFNLIKSQASDDEINFSINSKTSNTNGVYKTTETDSGKEVYYYRGNVNNNVIFNNMCWKIIRTTETGGVKMIYNGVPTNGQCNATGSMTQIGSSQFNKNDSDNAHMGYMYGTAKSNTYEATHANMNNSTIKSFVESWFNNNFKDSNIVSILENTTFCNDRSMAEYDSAKLSYNLSAYGKFGYSDKGTIYSSAIRSSTIATNPNPTLKCELENDRFNLKVGLITTDEAIFAGFNTYASNSYNYLDDNYLKSGSSYWTMTPLVYNENSYMYGKYPFISIIDNGWINYYSVSTSYGVRPVISLSSSLINLTEEVAGEGTKSNPFIVQ